METTGERLLDEILGALSFGVLFFVRALDSFEILFEVVQGLMADWS